jgi:hypothetical protein
MPSRPKPSSSARSRVFGTSRERGAIAYDADGYDPATVIRATAEAILCLGGTVPAGQRA